MSKVVSITAPSRVHITLVSMTDKLYRRNGGIGFAINGMDVCIKASISKKLNIVLSSSSDHMDERTISSATKLLKDASKKYSLNKSVEICVKKFPPQHSGFGSGTSFKLACLESLFLLNDIKLDKQELCQISSRGGTSGIGVNTYFDGGLVFDVGRKAGTLLPSNSCVGFELPLVMKKITMPEWEFGVYKSSKVTPLNYEQEIEFFKDNCRIENSDIYKLTHEIVFKLLPSLIDGNIDEFSESIKEIQDSTWKKSEWRAFDQYYEYIESVLGADSHCFGLSSLGTACYFLPKDKKRILEKITAIDPNGYIEYVTVNNSGRIVSYV